MPEGTERLREVPERLIRPREAILNPFKAIIRRRKILRADFPVDFAGVPERIDASPETERAGFFFLFQRRALCQRLSCRRRDKRAISQTVRERPMGRDEIMASARRRTHRLWRKRSLRASCQRRRARGVRPKCRERQAGPWRRWRFACRVSRLDREDGC